MNAQNTVSINVKRYFDLRTTSWRRWNAIQNEFTNGFVIVSHRTLSLKDMNLNRRLIVHRCRESFCLFGWDRRV